MREGYYILEEEDGYALYHRNLDGLVVNPPYDNRIGFAHTIEEAEAIADYYELQVSGVPYWKNPEMLMRLPPRS